ncbi:MAG: type II toxin-antitoxin system VapC family toxin [Candidatus Aminicenantes bacterium]|nr:type II toxin-antitoxin system VapC family toxin [Candidatus Aminicenantes bacterium]
MNGLRVVLDSNIIIYLSKGLLNFEDISARYESFYISIITYLEVLGFQFSDEGEKKIIEDLLKNFEMINIDPEIAENVLIIRQRKKIKLPDAIILATAKFLKCDLLTRNVGDFSDIVEDVNIVDPFENT